MVGKVLGYNLFARELPAVLPFLTYDIFLRFANSFIMSGHFHFVPYIDLLTIFPLKRAGSSE